MITSQKQQSITIIEYKLQLIFIRYIHFIYILYNMKYHLPFHVPTGLRVLVKILRIDISHGFSRFKQILLEGSILQIISGCTLVEKFVGLICERKIYLKTKIEFPSSDLFIICYGWESFQKNSHNPIKHLRLMNTSLLLSSFSLYFLA